MPLLEEDEETRDILVVPSIFSFIYVKGNRALCVIVKFDMGTRGYSCVWALAGHMCARGSVADCELSEWWDWSSCSVTCGNGTMTRTRDIVTQPVGGGAACGATEDETACNYGDCGTQLCCRLGGLFIKRSELSEGWRKGS